MCDELAAELMKRMDLDHNGTLDFAEAKPIIKEMALASIKFGPQAWAKRKLESLEQDEDFEMELSFKTLDFDKGGDLDCSEISGYLYRLMEEIRKDKGGKDRFA